MSALSCTNLVSLLPPRRVGRRLGAELALASVEGDDDRLEAALRGAVTVASVLEDASLAAWRLRTRGIRPQTG